MPRWEGSASSTAPTISVHCKLHPSGRRPSVTHGERLEHVRQEHAVENGWHQSCLGAGGGTGLRRATEVLSVDNWRHSASPGFSAKWKVAVLCRDSPSQ